MRQRWDRLGWIAALLAGAGLRAFFVAHHPRFVGDTLVYADLAQNLRGHHVYGLTEERIRPTLIRLPGYPLFLAFCFLLFGTGNFLPVVWVQVALDLLGCALLGSLARRLFGARAGLVAVWLAALCPFTANYTAAALTETGSIFCVTAALWATAGWVRALRAGGRGTGPVVVLGLAFACAALLRPDGVLLTAAVAPAMLRFAACERGAPRRRALLSLCLSLLMVLTPLGLWALRNWRVFHVVQPLAPKYANDPGEAAPVGFARWYRTWAVGYGATVRVYWSYDGSPLDLRDLPARAFDSPAQRRATQGLYDLYNIESSSTPAVEEAFARLGSERIRAHPARYYLWLPLARLGDMWLRPRTELMRLPLDWWVFRDRPEASAFAAGYGLLNLGLLSLAVAGWLRWKRWGWHRYATVAWAGATYAVLRSALLLTIDNSEPRYTLECYPFVLLLAALALAGPASSLSDERR